ncbi:PAS domain-containing sensor histidine kinase [Natrialba sp. INN-245]|uniref:two-component system sensor histidine kinase NtrB n=1 Tax=Natrialba sp. INN-245 TaxID=2690967 RepID=UPI0013106726|nr:PAS domain-containing sensor histidine kinase [Natrialba sp. INN-245]MWV41781.1 PAS domain S-box protein [Natrialba sp. INN-245]
MSGDERDPGRDRAHGEYQDLIDAMNDTAWVLAPDGRIEAVNESAVQTLGYSRETLLSMQIHEIDDGLEPDEITELIENMPTDGHQVFETVHEANDGTTIPVEISSSLVSYHGETRILSIARDITERKRYEEELERQRDDLELLNEVLRHDIRNDLAVIGGAAESLREQLGDESNPDLTTIQEKAGHAIGLTTTARDLARVMLQTEVDDQRVPLARTIVQQVAETRSGYPDADVTIEGELPAVQVNADELLEAVFRNLLQNAIQHNDTDTPNVTVRAETLEDRVAVRIADNGPGVPDSQKSAIFGRGEKGLASAGSGIGLYLVQTLVDRYGGTVRIEDNDPDGSVFVVELPITG